MTPRFNGFGAVLLLITACSTVVRTPSPVVEPKTEPKTPHAVLLGTGAQSMSLVIEEQEGDRIAYLSVPGLPFREGYLELTIKVVDGPHKDSTLFADNVVYRPTSPRADLPYTLPADLQIDGSETNCRISVYLFLPGFDPQKPVGVRSEVFRCQSPNREATVVDGRRETRISLRHFGLNSVHPQLQHRGELEDSLRKLAQEYRIVAVRIIGHSCDLGSPDAKMAYSNERARTAADLIQAILRGLKVEKTVVQYSGIGDNELKSMHGNEPEGLIEAQRDDFRGVDIIVEYTAKP